MNKVTAASSNPAPTGASGMPDELDDYERGFLDGLDAYAWWKDGTKYVGTCGRTYADAARDFLTERAKANAR